MRIRYHLKHKTTGEIVPVDFKGLECYHLSFVYHEWRDLFLPLIFWDEWDDWERYVPTAAERRAVKRIELDAKQAVKVQTN